MKSRARRVDDNDVEGGRRDEKRKYRSGDGFK